MNKFSPFLGALDLATWSPAGHIDPRVPRLLAEVARSPELVRDLVAS